VKEIGKKVKFVNIIVIAVTGSHHYQKIKELIEYHKIKKKDELLV